MSLLTIAGAGPLAIPPYDGWERARKPVAERPGDRVASVSGSGVSRRLVLRAGGAAGALGAGLLGGCDLGPGSDSQPVASPSPDADQRIVEAARAELSTLLVRLSATGGTASLVACHRAQLAALQGRAPSPTRTGRPLRPAQVVTRERRAAERFTHWAITCRNGDLARVLASVAAGIRMQSGLREAS
ncbi:MAG TPA: hypothetical protein VGK78_18325 [Nocardioides sp.]|uniref:hypothetical protein n=1 Tax=Nocardioides sp. TaxID=35761 RepID=UPI002F3F80F2